MNKVDEMDELDGWDEMNKVDEVNELDGMEGMNEMNNVDEFDGVIEPKWMTMLTGLSQRELTQTMDEINMGNWAIDG